MCRADTNLDGDIAQELVPFLKDEDDSQFEPDPEARAFFFGGGLIFASGL